MDKVSAMGEKRLSSYAKFTILKSNRLSVAHISVELCTIRCAIRKIGELIGENLVEIDI